MTTANEHTVWCFKAGRHGEGEPLCDKYNVAALGWKDLGDLSGLKTREDFKSRYRKAHPTEKEGAVPVNAGQLFRFIHEMKIGDLVGSKENTNTIPSSIPCFQISGR